MNINYIEYSINTKSLDIFFAGCNNRCTDCYNPILMLFENGTDYKEWFPKIEYYLDEYKSLISRIFLVGGSPNHQNSEELEDFLLKLRVLCNTYGILVYAFCGEELKDVQDCILKYCDRIKTGAYIPELTCDNNIIEGIKLATSNQKILVKGVDF